MGDIPIERESGSVAIRSLGVVGGLVAPAIIGYLRDFTADFRYGLGLIGGRATIVALLFYFMGHGGDAASPASMDR